MQLAAAAADQKKINGLGLFVTGKPEANRFIDFYFAKSAEPIPTLEQQFAYT